MLDRLPEYEHAHLQEEYCHQALTNIFDAPCPLIHAQGNNAVIIDQIQYSHTDNYCGQCRAGRQVRGLRCNVQGKAKEEMHQASDKNGFERRHGYNRDIR